VISGKTTVFGPDESSGDTVHIADFSSYRRSGSGYTLVVDRKASHTFDINKDIHSKLKYDALAYFYHNRSGIEITMPYAGEQQWTRPAGHLSDDNVECAPDTPGDYCLDVTGGWYDAGDHGKYVVNGGISVWTMMNQYERTLVTFNSDISEFADGNMNIPENDNNVPDILDESRWEMEFILKMQVPDGEELAGMAHHKIHDEAWTGLGLAPHEDTQIRYLRPPSTAATLNLAATAAQAARLWLTYDPAFSLKCLEAAEKAWKAARVHDDLLALVSDGNGGGAYNDDPSDEFYWAAVELFITTGETEYENYLTSIFQYLILAIFWLKTFQLFFLL